MDFDDVVKKVCDDRTRRSKALSDIIHICRPQQSCTNPADDRIDKIMKVIHDYENNIN